jgi:hypothetical protein
MGLGCFVIAISIPLREGTAFDLVSQLGGGLMGAAIVNFLAGPLREVNKPEE